MLENNKVYAFFINENFYGFTDTWDNCKGVTKGVNAQFKKFSSKKDASEFLKKHLEKCKNKEEQSC